VVSRGAGWGALLMIDCRVAAKIQTNNVMKQFTAFLGLVFRDSSQGTGHKQLNFNSMKKKKWNMSG
jgi:hypothetical protein